MTRASTEAHQCLGANRCIHCRRGVSARGRCPVCVSVTGGGYDLLEARGPYQTRTALRCGVVNEKKEVSLAPLGQRHWEQVSSPSAEGTGLTTRTVSLPLPWERTRGSGRSVWGNVWFNSPLPRRGGQQWGLVYGLLRGRIAIELEGKGTDWKERGSFLFPLKQLGSCTLTSGRGDVLSRLGRGSYEAGSALAGMV